MNLTKDMDDQEILFAAEEEMKLLGENQMFTLFLQGSKRARIRPDFDLLGAKYRIVDIVDETRGSRTEDSLLESNKDNIIGAVLRRLEGMPEASRFAGDAFEQASRGLYQRRRSEKREKRSAFYIRNIYIDGFGKFCGKELSFEPGLNIVYGPNESGKTTIKEFIVHMLFGLEKSRGIAARSDAYTIYTPVYGGNYGGGMEIISDGHAWLLERRFRAGEKSLHLYDKESGEEGVSAKLYTLSLGAYKDSFCIQEGDIPPSGNLSMELTNYTSNLTGSNTADIKIDLALKALKEKKNMLRRKSREESIVLSEKRERYLKAPESDGQSRKAEEYFVFFDGSSCVCGGWLCSSGVLRRLCCISGVIGSFD